MPPYSLGPTQIQLKIPKIPPADVRYSSPSNPLLIPTSHNFFFKPKTKIPKLIVTNPRFPFSDRRKHRVMEKKPSSSSSSTFSFFFKRMNKKGSESGSGGGGGGSAWRWKLKSSAGLRWKKRFNLHLWFIDDVLFKIVSAFEAVFLVSTLCFFFLCCGCHF